MPWYLPPPPPYWPLHHVQIVSSSYTAAAYLESIGYKQQRLAAGQAPCVLLMGSSGMRDELEGVGLQVGHMTGCASWCL
jgi:hypothetical protein